MTSASGGGRRSASIAYSSCVSRFHASAASIFAWIVAELLGGLIGVVGGQLVEAVEQRARGGHRLFDVALDVLGLVEVGLLLEHPHASRPARASPRRGSPGRRRP